MTHPSAGIKGLHDHYLAGGEGLEEEAWGGSQKKGHRHSSRSEVGAACCLLALAGTLLGDSVGIQLWELALSFPKLLSKAFDPFKAK